MQLFMGHIVSCLHFIERENIFSSYVSSTQFFFLKLGLCLFIYPHPFYFSQKLFFLKLVLFFLFLQGEKFFLNLVVRRGSCCSSQGELSLFHIELNCLCSLDSLFSLILFWICLLFIELSLSIRDKKGEIKMKCGNPVCFVQGRYIDCL